MFHPQKRIYCISLYPQACAVASNIDCRVAGSALGTHVESCRYLYVKYNLSGLATGPVG